jgi:hypothetical protein
MNKIRILSRKIANQSEKKGMIMTNNQEILDNAFREASNLHPNPSSVKVQDFIRALEEQLQEKAGFVPIQEFSLKNISPFTQIEVVQVEDSDKSGEISRLSVFLPAADTSRLIGKRPLSTFNNEGKETKGNIIEGRIVQISAFRPGVVHEPPSLSVKSYDRCEAVIPPDAKSKREIRDFSFFDSRVRIKADYKWSQAIQSVEDFMARLNIQATTTPAPSAELKKDHP